MNTLSFWIYMADVIGTANGFLNGLTAAGISVLAMAACVAFAAHWIHYANAEDVLKNYGDMNLKDAFQNYFASDQIDKAIGSIAVRDYAQKILKIWTAPLVAVLILSVITPSAQTVYMIIASEMAEEAFTTEEGEKLRQLLNERLDEFVEGSDADK